MTHITLANFFCELGVANSASSTDGGASILNNLLIALVNGLFAITAAVVAGLFAIAAAVINSGGGANFWAFLRNFRTTFDKYLKQLLAFCIGVFLAVLLWSVFGGTPPPFIAEITKMGSLNVSVIDDKANIKQTDTSSSGIIPVLENDGLKLEIVSKPKHGEAEPGDDLKIVYTFNKDADNKDAKSDSFSYRLRYGDKLISQPATVNITVTSITDQLYNNLQNHLDKKEWRNADQITKRIILRELNRSSEDR